MNKIKKMWNGAKWVVASAVCSAVAVAQVPTTLDGVAATGSAHLSTATTVAVGFAILGMGWAAYKVVKRFVRT